MDNSISVSGFPGSGKSTLCQLISESCGLNIVSAGAIMREMASARGLSVTEMNLRAEHSSELDNLIDERIRDVSRTGSFLFDSRLAWHFAENCKNIFLDVSVEQAARRALSRPSTVEETYADLRSASHLINERRISEVRRYKKFYGIDTTSVDNFDIYIFTDGMNATEVFAIVEPMLASSAKDFSGVFASPEFLVPTERIRHLNEDRVKAADARFATPIAVIQYKDRLFIWGDHMPVVRALYAGLPFVEVQLIDVPIENLSKYDFVSAAVSESLIDHWEDAMRINTYFNYELFMSRTEH